MLLKTVETFVQYKLPGKSSLTNILPINQIDFFIYFLKDLIPKYPVLK